MILTGKEIISNINKGNIVIKPFDKSQLNPNSYKLRLHKELLVYDSFPIDMKEKSSTAKIEIPESGLLLNPNTLYLGRTLEYTHTENLVPMIEGRSSIGRLGMFVHITAGFGDTGFTGYWTLEISVIHPTIIYPEIEICQIFYHTVQVEITKYSSGKYQNNRGIQASLLYKEFE
jgi:dCTP deaminase